MFDPHDNSLDAQLGNVPLPDGLMERLRQSIVPTDDDLDRELFRVAVPVSLVERLKQVVDDEQLDEEIRDVPVPWDLFVRLRRIPREGRVDWRHVGRVALAASIAILLTGLYFVGVGAMVALQRPLPTRFQDTVELSEVYETEDLFFPKIELLPPPRDLASLDETLENPPPIESLSWPRSELPTSPQPAGELAHMLAQGFAPSANQYALRWGQTLGYPQHARDNLPELEVVQPSRPRGIEPPLARGYDRRYFLESNQFPPLFPWRDPRFAQISPPLSTETTSFDLAARLVAEKRLPDPHEVRIEDFIAAMRPRFDRPAPGRLSLHADGGPSPFGSSQGRLLQIGVQAGDQPTRQRPATHLTIALDVSASMAWGRRLERATQAIEGLLGFLGPRDRLSLVAFDEEVTLAVDAARLDETQYEAVSRVRELLRALRPRGGTDFPAAIQTALAVAMSGESEPNAAEQLVVISDGRMNLPAEVRDGLESLLRSTVTSSGLGVTIHDLSDGPQPDVELSSLANACGGRTYRPRTAEDLRWSLAETLTGGSLVVAADAKLTVRFFPQSVLAYRLIGHGATTSAAFLPVAVPSELRASEAATVLFEVWVNPVNADDLGEVTVEWTDPAQRPAGVSESQSSGSNPPPTQVTTQRVSLRIPRAKFASSFASSSPHLQAAALAAETAEILAHTTAFDVRGRSTKPRHVRHLLEASRQLPSQVLNATDVARLVELLRSIDRQRLLAN